MTQAKPWQGLRVLVTGATSGIGQLVAEQLAKDGAQILVHGRSAEKVFAVADACGPESHGLVRDLASLDETLQLAREAGPIDVLINNAGIGFGARHTQREVSPDGFELRLAVNYLAPFLLTHALLRNGRIQAVVNVASAGQSPVDVRNLQLERGYDGMLAYRRSKLALIMFTQDLARERPDVAANSLHPGTFLDTGMVREAGITPMGKASMGRDSILHLLDLSLRIKITGQYFNERSESSPDSHALDASARASLKAETERLLARWLKAA